jgi:hypothetical protein
VSELKNEFGFHSLYSHCFSSTQVRELELEKTLALPEYFHEPTGEKNSGFGFEGEINLMDS